MNIINFIKWEWYQEGSCSKAFFKGVGGLLFTGSFIGAIIGYGYLSVFIYKLLDTECSEPTCLIHGIFIPLGFIVGVVFLIYSIYFIVVGCKYIFRCCGDKCNQYGLYTEKIKLIQTSEENIVNIL